MANRYFGLLLAIIFLIATCLLYFLQADFTNNMQQVLGGNQKLVYELQNSNRLRAVDRDLLGVESRIRAAIATGDTSHLEGINAKINQVNNYLDSISPNIATKPYVDSLHYLAAEKINIKNALIKRYHALGNMDDTSFIANPNARRISDKITHLTNRIFDIRHVQIIHLTNSNIETGQSAMRYGKMLIIFMFLSGALVLLFIIQQFRRQNKLIEQLNISEKKSKDALQIKENFLANMSHEIRTPLNSIIGFTHLLKKNNTVNDGPIYINSIENASQNLLEIVNDILDISKIEAGMMRIVKAPFNLSEMVQSVQSLFIEKAKEKGLMLVFQVDDSIPNILVGDVTRLTQILVNLVGNAIKFSPKGAIQILFTGQIITNGIIELTIIVKDDGIGIDTEKLESIFERFNQVEDSITRNYGGSGLGLSIVKQLIALQNGTIQVASKLGVGTTFTIKIPYEISHENTICNINKNETITPKIDQVNTRVLVVDDNQMNQVLMQHILKQWNLEFTIVSNGLEVLNVLKVKNFDLILMDIQMPIMDGYTTTKTIRDELKSDIPIIAMTAHALEGEREKCIQMGMNDYLVKPINETELKRIIEKYQPVTKIENNYKIIDLEYMREISGGDINYEKQVTQLFLDMLPKDLAQINSAIQIEDWNTVHKIAHNMKTTVGIMGLLPKLQNDISLLETQKFLDDQLQDALQNLIKMCNQAIEEATLFINHYKKIPI